jgi:capsule polysaccharide export protein KpsE/RkpR
MKFNEMQELMSEKLDIVHLSDIARELSVSPQVVNNWKKRNKVPYKYVKKLRQIEKDVDKSKNLSRDDLRLLSSINQLGSSSETIETEIDIIEDTINLLSLFKNILYNYYKFIFLCTFLGAFISLFYVTYLAPVVFKATMTILPIEGDSKAGAAGGIASQFGINFGSSGGNLSSVQLIPDLIKSKSLLSNLLNRKITFEGKKEKTTLMDYYFGITDSAEINRDFYTLKGINTIKNNIVVNKRKSNNLIDITVSFSDVDAVVDICFGIFHELDKIQKQISLSRTKDKNIYISERLLTVKEDLRATEEVLKKFRENNRDINNSPSLTLAENRLIREVASVSSIYNTLKSQYEIARVEALGSSRLIQIIDEPTKPIYRSSPKKKRSVIMSIIFGFFSSSIAVYLKELYHKHKEKLD